MGGWIDGWMNGWMDGEWQYILTIPGLVYTLTFLH